LYHSTLGSRVIKKKRKDHGWAEEAAFGAVFAQPRAPEHVTGVVLGVYGFRIRSWFRVQDSELV